MSLLHKLEQKFKTPQLQYHIIETNDIPSLSTVRVILQDKMLEMIFINLLRLSEEELLIQLGAKVYEEIPMVKKTRKKHNVFELVSTFKEIFGEKYSYVDMLDVYKEDSYVKMQDKVWIKCNEHNYYFQQTSSNHLHSNGYACPICLDIYNKSVTNAI